LKDTDTALAECEEEVQQLLGRHSKGLKVADSCVEEDAGPFAAAVSGLGMQQQELQADTSSTLDSITEQPLRQQQQQQMLSSRRLTSSSATSSSSGSSSR
jgi:hypothetical protein